MSSTTEIKTKIEANADAISGAESAVLSPASLPSSSLTSSSILGVEKQSGFARIRLNRPDKLNAFNEALHQDFMTALDEIAADQAVRALIITGTGRGFCTGQDLSDRQSIRNLQTSSQGNPQAHSANDAKDLGQTLSQFYNPLMTRLYQLDIPIVTAVNGVCAGAGIALALMGDISLVARSAKFAMAFGKIGLVPDSGLTWLLPRLIGMVQAKKLLLGNAVISAEYAQAIGMVTERVDDEQLQSEAERWAVQLGSNSRLANGLLRAALRASPQNNFVEQLTLEAESQRQAGYSAEYQEGVRAFLEKRPADFSRYQHSENQ